MAVPQIQEGKGGGGGGWQPKCYRMTNWKSSRREDLAMYCLGN